MVGIHLNYCHARYVLGAAAHSERGSHLRSNAFVRTLQAQQPSGVDGPSQAVRGAHARGFNAATESLLALLQKTVFDRQRWATREDLRLMIIT